MSDRQHCTVRNTDSSGKKYKPCPHVKAGKCTNKFGLFCGSKIENLPFWDGDTCLVA